MYNIMIHGYIINNIISVFCVYIRFFSACSFTTILIYVELFLCRLNTRLRHCDCCRMSFSVNFFSHHSRFYLIRSSTFAYNRSYIRPSCVTFILECSGSRLVRLGFSLHSPIIIILFPIVDTKQDL